MSKAIETLAGADATAFRTAIDPHVKAVLSDELETLAGLVYGDGLTIDNFTATPSVIETGGSATVNIAGEISGTVTGFSVTDSVSGAVATSGSADAFTASKAGVNSARTFTLSAENTGAPGGTDSKTATAGISFLNKSHLGIIDKSSGLLSSEVNAMASEWFENGASRTVQVTAGADGYVWYSQIASQPDPTFKLGGFSVTPVKTTRSHTNAQGYSTTYADFLLSARVASGSSRLVEIIR